MHFRLCIIRSASRKQPPDRSNRVCSKPARFSSPRRASSNPRCRLQCRWVQANEKSLHPPCVKRLKLARAPRLKKSIFDLIYIKIKDWWFLYVNRSRISSVWPCQIAMHKISFQFIALAFLNTHTYMQYLKNQTYIEIKMHIYVKSVMLPIKHAHAINFPPILYKQ